MVRCGLHPGGSHLQQRQQTCLVSETWKWNTHPHIPGQAWVLPAMTSSAQYISKPIKKLALFNNSPSIKWDLGQCLSTQVGNSRKPKVSKILVGNICRRPSALQTFISLVFICLPGRSRLPSGYRSLYDSALAQHFKYAQEMYSLQILKVKHEASSL